MKKITLLTTFLLLVTVYKAQNWNEIAKSLPSPYSQIIDNQHYGYSVDVDGNYAVIGAKGYAAGKGTAFVLFFDGTNWVTQAQLYTSDGQSSDQLGFSVSISGDNIILGAVGDDDGGSGSGSAYIFTKPATGWENMTETAKITATDAAVGDQFGSALSIDGDNIVVGVREDDDNGSRSGSAYVFTKPGASWTTMTETAKLTPSDGAADDFFGFSVDIFGDNIVIGANKDDDNGTQSGSAYIFTRPGANWTTMNQTAKLTASDGLIGDNFGFSVSIDGNDIVVGAREDDDNGINSGSAYVFTKPGASWITMTEIAKLTASDGAANDYFGNSVSISGNNIAIGAVNDTPNGNQSGSAYVFTKSGANWTTMTQTGKLTPSDGGIGDLFGFSVSISGNNILAGAYSDNGPGTNEGSAYVYAKPGANWANMIETEKVLSTDYGTNTDDSYGNEVAVDGNYAVIAAKGFDNLKGKAYVLFFNGSWILQAELTPSDGALNDIFGFSVSISGNNIVIGSVGDDDNGSGSGSAYVFTKSGVNWATMNETAKLTASDGGAGDSFGISVSISGDNIVVGAKGVDGVETNEGAAYVFTKPGVNWVTMTETAKLTASDRDDQDQFGSSVNISGNEIVIGALGDTQNGIISGSAYVFTKLGVNWITMTETAKLTPSDGVNFDLFGKSVGISGNDIVVGAPKKDGVANDEGVVYVFTKSGVNWVTMNETAKLTASDNDGQDQFGNSIAIEGINIVISAPGDDALTVNSGAAYVFTKLGANWINATETEKLNTFDAGIDDFLDVVSISGDNIVIGVSRNDDNGSNSGSAYLFRNCVETTATISPSACISYTSPSGKIVTTSSTFNDTISNVGLCDSIITINLTINQPVSNTTNNNVCDNSSFTYADLTVSNSITANESHTSTLTAANGCDSVLTENLTVLSQLTGSHNETVCFGGSILVNGTIYNASNLSGTEIFTNIGANNCDSTVAVILNVLPALIGNNNTTICATESVVINGTIYNVANPTGTEIFTNIGVNNCDSTVTVALNVLPAIDTSTSTSGFVITSNQTGATYQWIDCNNGNNAIVGETNINYTTTANGDYAVVVTIGSCSDTSACINIVGVGIEDVRSQFDFIIYPNPANNFVQIKTDYNQKVKAKLLDVTGKLVLQKDFTNNTRLNVKQLNKGLYLLILETERDVITKKVMIQ